MRYKALISVQALHQLCKLDPHVARILLASIHNQLDNSEDPRWMGKALCGKYKGMWRYRFGDYRIPVEINDLELIIHCLGIGYRREICF